MPGTDQVTDPSTTSSRDRPTTATQLHAFNVMPRPGQPDALEFDGNNVTEWLEEWNLQCEDYGLTDPKKCARLPYYCVPAIKDVVKFLPGYMSDPPDWTVLQNDLKELYWQFDKPKNTTTALYQLIHDSQAGTIPLNVYILKYTSISNILVSKGALSSLDRVGRLLDGLPEDLRRKVLKFCTKRKWKLSSQDIGTSDPDYKELEDFVLTEARSLQKETVYNKEKAMREGRPEISYSNQLDQSSPTSMPSVTAPIMSSAPPPSTMPSATSTTPTSVDSIADLTKQFSQMVLAAMADFTNAQQARTTAQGSTSGANPTSPAPMSSTSASRPPRPQHCLHCDSLDHMRKDCKEFDEALRLGIIRWGGNGRIINSATGLELPLMFGKGGMKALLAPQPTSTPVTTTTASSNSIMLNSRYGSIGEGTVLNTTLDFENNIRTDEIIDVEINEKRKRGDINQARRIRSRIDDVPTLIPVQRSPPRTVQMEEVSDEDMSDLPVHPYQTRQVHRSGVSAPALAPASISAEPKAPEVARKFKLASEVGQTVGTSQIGEKIMDTPVQLSIREILAVSGDVAGYLHDQTRKRRVPLDSTTSVAEIAITGSASSSSSSSIPTVNVSSSELKSYYALPSGRAKVTIDDRITVNALLDNGSEVNMMPRHIYEQLNLPIDTEIRWQINAYNTDTNLEDCGPIGVCHDVLISIGGVESKQHIFIVEKSNWDLLLGRPWERAVRAEYVNEDDGSYTVRIKSRDGRRHVQFIAVNAEHDRNREYVRHPVDAAANHLTILPLKRLGGAFVREKVPQPQDRSPDSPLDLITLASQAFGAYVRTLIFEPLELNTDYDQIISRRRWEDIVEAKYKKKGKKVLSQNVSLPNGINSGGGINDRDMTARILGKVGDDDELKFDSSVSRYPPPEPHLQGKTIPRGSRLTPARLANMKIGVGFLLTRMQQLDSQTVDQEQASENLRNSRKNNKAYFDQNKPMRSELQQLHLGDLVLVHISKNQLSRARKIKIHDRWIGPYRIREIPTDSTYYLLEELDGVELKENFAGNRLKKFFTRRELDENREEQHAVIRIRDALDVEPVGANNDDMEQDQQE